MAAVKNFCANARDHDVALKRGGGTSTLSIDFQDANQRYQLEPVDGWTADAIYDRNWALSLLRDSLDALEADYRATGKPELFEALRPHLTASVESETLSSIAAKLGNTTGAMKVALHRLRRAYRQKLTQAVNNTLDVGQDNDSEREFLFRALGNP